MKNGISGVQSNVCQTSFGNWNAYGKVTVILGSYVIRESMIKDYILTLF